ncbi:MAG: crossover junction endodeoxyribonuclease RuvC [Candidatus Omnitrophica bacterium]|nr:crossover junction endodeoxyribonuclease RuvC [Candidatus Omnitrophota bacterium]
MLILGVDPGLITTGYGVVDVAGGTVKVIEAGTIKPSPKDAFERRIAKVHQHIAAIIGAHKPDTVVLEKLYAHYKHPATACVLGHVRGVICLAVAQSNTPLVEWSVKRIRKALLGNGNAAKPQVQDFVKRLLNIPKAELGLDTSDALALALGHAHMLRFKLI